MRKLAAAVLAVPVVATIYLPILFRRRVALRLGAGGLAVALIAAIATLGLAAPPATVATAPLPPVVPLTTDAFNSTISAGSELQDPVSITFSAPMDGRSVAASLDVEPATAVDLAWDETGTHLTVTPKARWQAATYHT
ncbi:MAG TPA: Ig-like domain-containing protein, partial [Candidatus Limnocylindrales bacterium]